MAIVLLAAIGPMLWVISRRVRAGQWADHDVSVQKERNRLYPVALAVAALTLLLLIGVQPPRDVIAGTVAILALVGLSSIVNLFLKVSLHTGFAVFTAVVLLPGSPWVGGAAAVLAAAIAWSRLELKRHTPAEVLGGALLGGMEGAALVLWPW